MSRPILYTTPLSPPGRSVELTVKEMGLDLDIRHVNLANGEHMTEKYLKMNPQHTVPTLVDGDNILWDSHAINIYLVRKYGKPNHPLYPEDVFTQAKIMQHLHFNSGVLFARARLILEPVLFYGCPEVPKEKIDNIYKAYDLLESVLQTSPYLVGDHLTLADLSCITTVSSLSAAYPLSLDKYPKINAWINRLAQLPYYADVNQKGVDLLIQKFNGALAANKTTKK